MPWVICSASDGDVKSHMGNLGICALIDSLHRMLTVCRAPSKNWGQAAQRAKQSLRLHSTRLCSRDVCDHPALRDNSREETGLGGS